MKKKILKLKMPCTFRKNLDPAAKSVCDHMQYIGPMYETCPQMSKYTCDNTPACCIWKMSGWDITWIVLASLAGVFCLCVICWYYIKVYLK